MAVTANGSDMQAVQKASAADSGWTLCLFKRVSIEIDLRCKKKKKKKS